MADLFVQVQTINDVSLSGEYIDATITTTMSWIDLRLRWNLNDFGNINQIECLPSHIWTPDIDVINRVHDFSATNEKPQMATIEHNGNVLGLDILQHNSRK